MKPCSPISEVTSRAAPAGAAERRSCQTFPISTRSAIGGDRRRQRLHRFKQVPIRFLLPNFITLLALCSGLTAIRLGVEGRYEWAVVAVIVAIVLDAVDGRLARLLKGTSRFGAELDSLADFVNFGVAPAVLIYMWSLNGLRSIGWIAALGLAICCALRLARFNVSIDDPDKPAWTMNYFTGAPAPAGSRPGARAHVSRFPRHRRRMATTSCGWCCPILSVSRS